MTFSRALWSPAVNKEGGFESQTHFAGTSLGSLSALLCKNEIKISHRIQKVTINPPGDTKLSHGLIYAKEAWGNGQNFLTAVAHRK